MMECEETPLDGLLVLRPRIFADDRGRFLEPFNSRTFRSVTGLDVRFVQDNESRSRKGVLRGLHLQVAPHAQAKLVRVAHGRVLDVCVDLRPHSPTFGHHFKLELTDEGAEMIYIPTGFGHGFVALSEGAVFQYKCSDFYHPPSERIVRWDDPELAIDWGVKDPLVSARDQQGSPFASRSWIT